MVVFNGIHDRRSFEIAEYFAVMVFFVPCFAYDRSCRILRSSPWFWLGAVDHLRKRDSAISGVKRLA
jgi:hypothetical protein